MLAHRVNKQASGTLRGEGPRRELIVMVARTMEFGNLSGSAALD